MSLPRLAEPELALRYSLWRLGHLALGREELSKDAVEVSIDVVSPDEEMLLPTAEVVVLGQGGTELERILFQSQPSAGLTAEALKRIRSQVLRARKRDQGMSRLRLVSPNRLVRIQDERTLRDLSHYDDRCRALVEFSIQDMDGEDIVWDLGRHTPGGLMAESLFDLSLGQKEGDVRPLYQDLYESLRGQIRATLEPRHPSWGIEIDLYSEKKERRPRRLARAGEVQWWRDTIVAGIRPVERPSAWPEISETLRRGLFSEESPVTLAEIYVHQGAQLLWPDDVRKSSALWFERALDLLFRWWSEQRWRREEKPLLVMGSFGSGKSSLLTLFAERLLHKRTQVVPLLIPLRDLRGASMSKPLHEVLVEHVRRHWDVDLDAPPLGPFYCLLCDGFDELNLYYLSVASEQWVSECFRSLCLLAERPGIDVVISSRPILFMDVAHRDFEGGSCPRLDLRLFEPPEIDQWCISYRRAAGLPDFFTSNDLEARDLLDVARTPLILYMLGRIYQVEKNAFQEKRPYTRAEVYRWFVDWTEKGGYRRDATKHVVPRNYRKILRETARYFYRHGDGFVEEEKILEHLRSVHGRTLDRIPIDRNLLVAHMFQPVSDDPDEPRHLVEFTHQSFRDYLFAEWIWEQLTPARRGEDLDPKTWNELGVKPVPPQEVAYLSDMISIASWDEVLALYQALAQTESVHQYWGKWLSYAWTDLRSDPRPETVDELRDLVTVTATRAVSLATLGFILRTRCFARLRQLAAKAPGRSELPSALSTKDLGSLLHLLKTFPDQGVGNDNRRVLLANLSGLVLLGAALDGHQLENVDFSGSRLCKINFSASRWLEADLRNADLEGASLRQCLLNLKATDGASFRNVELGDTILTHAKDGALVGADFTGADFFRTRFLDLTFRECRFAGNRWEGAARYSSREDRPSLLVRCELDEAAEAFFVDQGFHLEGCWITDEPEAEEHGGQTVTA